MSSISQAEIKQVRSLREKKFRDELGLSYRFPFE